MNWLHQATTDGGLVQYVIRRLALSPAGTSGIYHKQDQNLRRLYSIPSCLQDMAIFYPQTPNHLPCQFPWLMLPQSSNGTHHRRAFFDLANNKIHYFNLPELSHQRRIRLCGSSHGWIAVLQESPCVILLNPLTRKKINLPPLSSFPNVINFDYAQVGAEYSLRSPDLGGNCSYSLREMCNSFISRFFLSTTPSTGSHFVVVAVVIRMDVLAYCKRGESSWKYIEEARSFTEDVTYLNGLFYAVNKYGKIAICDLNGDSPVVEIIHTPELTLGGDIQCTVNMMDELLLVTRFLEAVLDIDPVLEDSPYKTTQFRLFKLDFAQQKWQEMRSLGNMVLFVGNSSSLALLASDFPGCKGNKIYFVDDHSEFYYYDARHGDVGVFNLDDGSFDTLPCCPRNSYSQLLWPRPVWVTMNPC